MTEEDKILVTKWMGEKWHSYYYTHDPLKVMCSCNDKELPHFIPFAGHKNRTYTTPDDFFGVWDTLVKKGKACEFLEWGEKQVYVITDIGMDHVNFFKWLHATAKDGTFNFINLVAQALKEGEVSNV